MADEKDKTLELRLCEHCPLNREVNLMLEHHERRVTKVELELEKVRDFVTESRLLRQLTMGGGLLSIITLAITIINLVQNAARP